MPLSAKQNTTPARSNMGNTHPSILVVWYKAAREQLITNNPSWLEKTKQDLSPAAIWNFKNAGTIPFLEPPTERILPKMAKICRLPKDSRNTVINANFGNIRQHKATSDTVLSQVPSHNVQQKRLLELKAPNWKEWAFTDGSCNINKENGSQSIGAQLYHPQWTEIVEFLCMCSNQLGQDGAQTT